MGKTIDRRLFSHTYSVFFFVSLIIFLSGCDKSNDGNHSQLTIVDISGRSVQVPVHVERIVCKGPGTLRLITYLESTDKVVGIEGGFEKEDIAGRPYRIAHQALSLLPTIGQAGPCPQAESEQVLCVNPDVIFVSKVDLRMAENLQEKTRIPVVVLDVDYSLNPQTECVYKSLRLAGDILGKSQRATEVINYIKQSETDLKRLAANYPQQGKPSVYIGGLSYKGCCGITSTQANFPAIHLLGINSVVDTVDQQGHITVNKEQLLKWNPDIIFIDGASMEIFRADYQRNPSFYDSIRAFEHDQVYILFPYNCYATNISTVLANYYYMGTVLYGPEFGEVTAPEKADEIYSFLVGAPVFNRMQEDYAGFEKLKLKDERVGEANKN